VADSASDAYGWEVENAVDKRVPSAAMLAERLAGDASAAQFFGAIGAAGAGVAGHAATHAAYKVFLHKTQLGPYSRAELAAKVASGEIDAATRVWDMRWVPRIDQWRPAGELAELAPLFQASPFDPDGIPDPE